MDDLRKKYASVAAVIPEVGQLLDRIEALQSAQAWRPIESAPTDGTKVLQFGPRRDGGHYYETGGYWVAGKCWPVQFMDEHKPPTHWLPLPAPPLEAK